VLLTSAVKGRFINELRFDCIRLPAHFAQRGNSIEINIQV